MRITNFQAPGLDDIITYIEKDLSCYNDSIRKEKVLRNILKTINITFSIEGLNRYQSTLLCELNDSYTQQSQRYVTMKNTSFDELNELLNNDEIIIDIAKELLNNSMSLYQKMSVLKDVYNDVKGRKNKSQYIHAIPIEDARYCLPLLCKTNIHVTTTGDKLLDIVELLYSDIMGIMQNDDIYIDLGKYKLSKLYFKKDINSLEEILKNTYQDKLFEKYKFDDNDTSNVKLIHRFYKPETIVAVAAATSGSDKVPSELTLSFDNNDEATKLTDRVMGYGHTSIIEHARTTCLFRMSLSAYHQFIRHRLPSNYRGESLIKLTSENNGIYVPDSIKVSKFEVEYHNLFRNFYNFRQLLRVSGYSAGITNQFLLNGDMIHVISSSNCRADNHIMRDRLCNTAQTEIRELFEEKYNIVKNIYPENFIKEAIPPCVYGKCKEGKMTCGNQTEMTNKYNKEIL